MKIQKKHFNICLFFSNMSTYVYYNCILVCSICNRLLSFYVHIISILVCSIKNLLSRIALSIACHCLFYHVSLCIYLKVLLTGALGALVKETKKENFKVKIALFMFLRS